MNKLSPNYKRQQKLQQDLVTIWNNIYEDPDFNGKKINRSDILYTNDKVTEINSIA